MVLRLDSIGRYFSYACRYLLDRVAVIGANTKKRNALLVIRPDAIGDFVVWLDSARVLREHYSEKKIILLANQNFAELAEKLEYFDEVIAVDVKKFERDLGYRFRKVRQIRSLGAEIAIQPIYSRQFWIGDVMIRASGASQRIGSKGDLSNMRPWQLRIASGWYTTLVPASTGHLNELERNSEFLHGLGLGQGQPSIAKLTLAAELQQHQQITDAYFIIFPGAGSPERMWPPSAYAEVARAIAAETGWRMVVCGSGVEAELADTIITRTKLHSALNLAGRTSVPELVEVIRGACMLVGSETSAVHIAAAVGTPSVCLLGGGHFGRFVPYPAGIKGKAPVPVFHKMECYGCNWQCTQPHETGAPAPCITSILIEDVIAATESIMLIKEGSLINTH